jgi:hypothetical protein
MDVDSTTIRVAGGVWICPSSDIGMRNFGAGRVYTSIQPNHGQETNAYTGLREHWASDARYRTNGAGVTTTPATYFAIPKPSWEIKFHKGRLHQVPFQWCSMRLSPPMLAKGTSVRSWHFPGGRPTLFMDGHVTVLNNRYHKGDFDHMLNSGAVPMIHAYREFQYVTPQGTYFGAGNRFGLSEY